jgi:ribosomal protein S18 acetylase RimI-like enzyme
MAGFTADASPTMGSGFRRDDDDGVMALTAATDADIPAVVALVNLAYRGREGWTPETLIVGQRTDAQTLRADIAAAPHARLLLHHDTQDRTLLGTVWLEPDAGGTWYLGMLAVRPDLQERRLGRSILAAAEAIARAEGARTMRMTVVNLRHALIAWYERRGYAITGETIPFPYGDDRFGVPLRDDLHFTVLEKPLDPGASDGRTAS